MRQKCEVRLRDNDADELYTVPVMLSGEEMCTINRVGMMLSSAHDWRVSLIAVQTGGTR